jgi:RNA polymerase sigma-54 factor
LTLVQSHWDALVKQRHTTLCRKLGVSQKRIDAALLFIRKLKPNPAAGFRMPWDHRQNGQSRSIRPDVIIKRSGVGFTVEVLGFDNNSLQVNPYYRGLYDTIRSSRQSGEAPRDAGVRLSVDHQKHVIAYVERANMFLKNLQQRRRTIQKITMTLIECQQGFLETGQRSFLRPLTRTNLAKMVGMHESTVSRALLYKYVQLPSQDVLPFDIFFENAVTIKGVIAALVSEETQEAPLSDQELVDALAARGLHVARRTVVKYREEMRISASYLRRRQMP